MDEEHETITYRTLSRLLGDDGMPQSVEADELVSVGFVGGTLDEEGAVVPDEDDDLSDDDLVFADDDPDDDDNDENAEDAPDVETDVFDDEEENE